MNVRSVKCVRYLMMAVTVIVVMNLTVNAQSMGPPFSPNEVRMSLARFESLFESANEQASAAQWRNPRLEIDLLQVKISGEAWVTFTADIDVSSVSAGSHQVTVDLLPSTVHPVSIWQKDKVLSPFINGSFHQVKLPILQDPNGVRTTQSIKLQYPVRLTKQLSGEVSGMIPLPPVANAQVRVVGKGHAKFIPDLKLNQAQVADHVTLRGALALLIPSSEAGPLLQSKNLDIELHSSGEGANVKVTIQSLLRGGVLQAWIPISPADHALLKATADGKTAITDVRNGWHMVWVEGVGSHLIKANTRVKVDRSSGQPRLTLSPQSAPRSKLSLRLPGDREVVSEPLIPLSSKTVDIDHLNPNLQKEDFVKETRISADLPPLQQLTLRWTEKRLTPEEESPEFISETYQLFSVQEGLLKGQAQLEIDIIKGELKSLDIEVPNEVVLYHLSGMGVDSWVTIPYPDGQGIRETKTVRVTFGEARSGKNVLALKWQRVLSHKEQIFMPLIRPLNAFQESGVIALFDGDRVGFTPAKPETSTRGEERLLPVGQESIPPRILQLKSGEKVSQAFRHVQAPTSLQTSTTTERARELRFDAQLDTLYSLRDGAVRAQAQLLLNLKSGRLEDLVINLPVGCSEPQVSGPSINRVEPLPQQAEDQGRQRYQIKFTRRLEGAVTLNVDVEKLISSGTATLSFPRIILEGAELTQGYIGLTAEPGLEVSPTETNELRRVTLDELPRSISLRAATEVLYGYRFSRDWSINAALKRHKIIETLSAEATILQLRSYLLESGQRVDHVRFVIENRDRRTFKLTLPPKSSIQEVKVNKQSVRARAEGKQISIPIPKNQKSQVLVRYEVSRAVDQLEQYKLTGPSSDLRTTNITWDIFFSENRQLWSWQGDLSETEARSARLENQGGYHSLGHQVRFRYDLLSANRAPLKLKLSLRGVISDQIVKRMQLLALLALILIGLHRGLLVAGTKISILRHTEVAGIFIIIINLGVLLYQGTMYELEDTFFFSLKCLFLVFISTWIGWTIYLKSCQLLKQLSVMKVSKTSTATEAILNDEEMVDDVTIPSVSTVDQLPSGPGDLP